MQIELQFVRLTAIIVGMQDAVPRELDFGAVAGLIRQWGRDLGFAAVGISDVDLRDAEPRLAAWLAKGRHGAMDYMAKHGEKRSRPDALLPGTLSVISARMNYLPPGARDSKGVLDDPTLAFVSRYALGCDYHKLIRSRLRQFAAQIEGEIGAMGYRVFVDSAPVMEVELARKAGLGWRGKHTLLLDRDAGSYFFLGEIFTDLPLPADAPVTGHCGTCTRCIDVCPTQAIVAPYELDARRCISYLTIELKESIPVELRPLIGNRVYGCDDCQLTCPWNRYAQSSGEPDFAVRNGLDGAQLVALFAWSEDEFLSRLAGSAILRVGYERWLRNLAVGLGNGPSSPAVMAALESRRDDLSPLVREHVAWAIAQQRAKGTSSPAAEMR
jgi:epoxyqueuosine reductase